MTKIILDCDPGIDDALAILFALGDPDLEVMAITAVAGNRPVTQTFENARRLAALAGRSDIPVYKGAAAPLGGSMPRTNLVHGADGLGGVDLPPSQGEFLERPAAQAIIDILANEDENTISLVAIGPLTNLALAQSLSPETFARAERLAIMGGSVTIPGNVTPAAEFNFWADPIAADQIFQSNVEIELFGLDVTSQAICTEEWLNALARLPGPAAEPISHMIANYFAEDPLLHDPCPIAWLMKPELFTSTPMHIRIETAGPRSVGQSIGWMPERPDSPAAPNARVHTGVNAEGLLTLMYERLYSLGANSTC
ncbi:nucleoside hydrolase [Oricola sp.]|uniref:nucleoside hydrolase n=1 Tax=Oricola sp. TaxID=1979950 RepID=UPI003BAAFFC0